MRTQGWPERSLSIQRAVIVTVFSSIHQSHDVAPCEESEGFVAVPSFRVEALGQAPESRRESCVVPPSSAEAPNEAWLFR